MYTRTLEYGKNAEAAEEYPINLGFYGKGNCSTPGALEEQILAGAVGLKIHEDWGATPGSNRYMLKCS